jgi:hypothetical protein
MTTEEDGHRHRLIEVYRQRFGDHITLIRLLDDLAQDEQRHQASAEEVSNAQAASGAVNRERDVAKRLFALRFIQPGLAGLMDGPRQKRLRAGAP